MDKKEKRRESIRACNNFSPQAWKPDKCLNCFLKMNEHLNKKINPYEIKKLDDLLESSIIELDQYETQKRALLEGSM